MYATILRTTFGTLVSASARERSLGIALAALPGFLAFIALESDPASGAVTMVCLFDRQAGCAAAECAIARWQGEAQASVGPRIRRLGAGAVMAQKGL